MIKIGIIGGAGYTAGELIRILLQHPSVQIAFVQSQSHAGQAVTKVHQDLVGETELLFSNDLRFDVDVLFLCQGHGQAVQFLQKNSIPSKVKIIDLGNDFRLEGNALVQNRKFVYGLPELYKKQISEANSIANPGCFATAIQLALLPLASEKLLNADIHIHAITGSTGAGQSLTDTVHFTWRTNNISIYKAFTHQHLGEIRQSIQFLQNNFQKEVNFIPVRGNFTRGIFATLYLDCQLSENEAKTLYSDYYRDAAFTHLSDSDEVHLKQVVNTNKCLLHVAKYRNKILITSIIDNLLKGASGQAVQNMNLMCGLPEKEGLNLKASYF
ncbi:MAG: N-acetyl-gamma-glutamyl-phosphate reductase [Flammeovirgaceae bacterium]